MFVVFEGLDGAGKTTQVSLLSQSLEKVGQHVVTTREPGGTTAGEAIRDIMFGDHAAPLRPLTWVFLMNAARAQLVADVIRPALGEGAFVIADRYWYSTMAYQGGGDGVDESIIRRLSETATTGIEPDHIFYLAVPPGMAMRRKLAGRRDVLDSKPLDFHERVAAAYRRMAEGDRTRWHVVDGTLDEYQLSRVILAELEPVLASHVALAAK